MWARWIAYSTSLEICEQRDVKGLYKKARAGQLPNLSGLGSAYEPPIAADIEISSVLGEPDSIAAELLETLMLFDNS